MKFVVDMDKYYDFNYRHMSRVSKMSSELRKNSNIIFMVYSRVYDDGSLFDLNSELIMDWNKKYYSSYFAKEYLSISHRLKSGINYWRNNTSNELCEQREYARKYFDIDARIDFVYRDEINKCFHIYCFCSDSKHADKAHAFYGNHMDKLVKFTCYFNQEAKDLIVESQNPKNRIMIQKYIPISLNKANAARNYADELRRERASFEPTSREFDVMLLYAHGVSKPKIAKMLCKGVSTIETHIDHIKTKSNLKDRFSMLMYLKDKNWDDAINFFFPYIPRHAA